MCGIAGFFGKGGADKVRAMCDLMAHRGPDDFDMRECAGFAIGQRRLSINDLAGGRQPLTDPSGKLVLVCNGEIYNYPELRAKYEAQGYAFKTRSDSEIVLPLYLEYGEKCVEKLRGMFGFALWDSEKRRLLLARDHMGQKPVFFAAAGDSFAFASEPKCILASGLLAREPDLEALWHYMSLRYLPDDRTLFKGVRKLPAAHYAVWEGGKVRTQRYWKLDTFRNKLQGDEKELTDALEKLLLKTDKAFGQVVNIGNPSEVTILDLAKTIKKQLKSKSEIQHLSYAEAYQDGGFEDMRRRVPSIEKAKKLIGFAPKKTLRDIIADVAKEFRSGQIV